MSGNKLRKQTQKGTLKLFCKLESSQICFTVAISLSTYHTGSPVSHSHIHPWHSHMDKSKVCYQGSKIHID